LLHQNYVARVAVLRRLDPDPAGLYQATPPAQPVLSLSSFFAFFGPAADKVRSPLPAGFPVHCPALDDIRGIAALWVVLYHAHTAGHVSSLTAALPMPIRVLCFDWGYLGVPVFFVLSGFVLAHSLFSRSVSRVGFWRFMTRRFLRLAPAYWASIAITILLGVTESAVRGEALALPSVLSLGAHLLFLQDLLHQLEINPVYWTLAIEMQFYALFYAVLLLNSAINAVRSSKGYAPFLVFAGALALFCLAAAPQLLSWGKTVLPYWYCFLLGILTHWSLCRRIHYGWLLALLISCGLLVAPRPALVSTYVASCGLTAVLLGLAASGRLTQSSGWMMCQLGNLSYSVYLIHGAVFGPFFFLRQRVFGRLSGADWSADLSGVAIAGLEAEVILDGVSLVGAIALTYGAALLLYRWVEQPSLQWSRRLRMQR